MKLSSPQITKFSLKKLLVVFPKKNHSKNFFYIFSKKPFSYILATGTF